MGLSMSVLWRTRSKTSEVYEVVGCGFFAFVQVTEDEIQQTEEAVCGG